MRVESGNTEILKGFKSPLIFFMGFRIHFGIQTGTLEIVKNDFCQTKENKIYFLEEKCDFWINHLDLYESLYDFFAET